MSPLDEVLAEPRLRNRVEVVAGSVSGQPARSVLVIEDLHELDGAGAGDVAVLTARASASLETYRLDGALRVAASRGVVALVLTASDAPISRTSAHIAAQASIAIVRIVSVPLAELVVALSHGLTRDAHAALDRLRSVAQIVENLPPSATRAGDLLERASTALGCEIVELEPADPADDRVAAAIVVGSQIEGQLAADPADGAERLAAPIALPLVAGAVARVTAASREADEGPAVSSAETVTELLLSDGTLGGPLLRRARALGVPIDTWHIAMAIDTEGFAELVGGDEVRAYELRIMLTREAFRVAEASGGSWYRARVGTTLLLFRGDRLDPGHRAPALLARTAEKVLARMGSLVPEIALTCGIGTPYPGPHGIRTTAAEAQTALRIARANGRFGEPVLFDPASLHRTLIEWYASDTARTAVSNMLAPLEKLDPKRRDTALRTLRAYLDSGSSFSRTAEAMHLHRNAVAYRIKNILKTLDVDLDEPDQRLMLHLACRADALP